MNRSIVIGAVGLLAGMAGIGLRVGTGSSATSLDVPTVVSEGLDSLDARLEALDRVSGSLAARRRAFTDARHAFKRIEPILSFYAPDVVAALNSDEVEAPDEDRADGFKSARGFQLLEVALYPDTSGTVARDAAWASARAEIGTMRSVVAHFRPSVPYLDPNDDDLVEIARLELARVATLGIAGFDASLSGQAVAESADAIEGTRALLRLSRHPAGPADSALARAAGYLREHPEFAPFDRFQFVRDFAQPAFVALAGVRRAIGAAGPPTRRVWPAEVASVYDARAFDVMAYAPPGTPPPSAALVERGRELFHDRSLSGGGVRACASCHVPEHAFTDGLPLARPLDPKGPHPKRNTPSLVNAAMQPFQFADERRATLEEQIGDVITNPAEMGGSKPSPDVRLALASYIRSLTRFNSRFDRAIRGEIEITAAERRGFNLFMGKAECGTCHFAPFFDGTLPPGFVTSDPEVLGVPARPDTARAEIDPDPGRGAIDRRGGMAHAFKTPTVRNAVLTAPYTHAGVYATLGGLLDFYDRGGGAGIGIASPNQTLSSRRLHLTAGERHDLIDFMAALTDTAGIAASTSGASAHSNNP